MEVTSRQTIIGPEDMGSKGVLVINDIDLVIPPTNISISKEDLTYQYRTLRTKVATKIPTGHGRTTVQMTLPFTTSELLTMHRLIVELRNNPFCYIDNRFIRESIVPDWPYGQNMAFTLRSMSVRPMDGAANTWLLDLELIWFNYFPFMYNFLYREEWQTNYLQSERADIFGHLAAFSIGWSIDPDTYETKHRPSLIHSLGGEEPDGGQQEVQNMLFQGDVVTAQQSSWSNVRESYTNSRIKTVYQMMVAHPGMEFDLNPLPGNMSPARFVTQPKHSRIYVRYINYLQRDALMRNFGIDAEADIIADDTRNCRDIKHRANLYRAVFETTEVNYYPEVYPLHSSRIPRYIRRGWVDQMLRSNSGIRFLFNQYREIRLPQRYHEQIEKNQSQVLGSLYAKVQSLHQAPVQAISQVGGSNIAIPLLGAPARLNSPFGIRVHPVTKKVHNHTGLDIQAAMNTALYAPEDGEITRVDRLKGANGNALFLRAEDGGQWAFCHLNTMLVGVGTRVTKGDRIGLTGNTGRSTGPHLHVEYRRPRSNKVEDPTGKLSSLLQGEPAVAKQEEDYSFLDSEDLDFSVTAEAEALAYNMMGDIEVVRDDLVEKEILKQAQEDIGLSEGEAQELKDMLAALANEGWMYYDRDTSVINVWQKALVIEINHSGNDILRGITEIPEQFVHEGAVLTNVGAGVSHIVANIPILSHEYPTQQHLGSIEPLYQLEFAVMDSEGDLGGIPVVAQTLRAMESILQSNARKYRFITDGWAVSVDTFITRLFGSYTERDLLKEQDEYSIKDLQLKKRLTIARSSSETVEGSPGLSVLRFDLEETNPYQEESLVSSSSALHDRESARQEVLNAVYGLKFTKEYSALRTLLQMHESGILESGEDLGLSAENTLILDRPMVLSETAEGENFLFYDTETGQEFIITRNLKSVDQSYLDELGVVPTDVFLGTNADLTGLDPRDISKGWLAIPYTPEIAEALSMSPVGEGLDEPLLELEDNSIFTSGFAETIQAVDYPLVLTGRRLDLRKVADDYPGFNKLALERFLDFYNAIHQLVLTGNRLFSEEEVGGYSKQEIQSALYDLPVQNNLWQSWQTYLRASIVEDPTWTRLGDALANPNEQLNSLHANPAWPMPANDRNNRGWDEPLVDEEREAIEAIANENYGWFGSPTGFLAPTLDKSGGFLVTLGIAALSSDTDVVDAYEGRHAGALARLVDRYLRRLPCSVYLPDLGNAFKELVGDLLGNFLDERDKAPAVESMFVQLYKNIYSCGNMTYSPLDGNPWWETSLKEETKWNSYGKITTQVQRTGRGGFYGGISQFQKVMVGLAAPSEAYNTGNGRGLVDAIETGTVFGMQTADRYLGTSLEQQLYPEVAWGAPLNTPFVYLVEKDTEKQRLDYLKSLFATLGDQILSEPEVLRLLGLEALAHSLDNPKIKGMECYPDIDLPTHPYFGDTFQTGPGFYMWNIYEDGGALGPEEQEEIYRRVFFVLQNSYDSLKRMENGNKYDPKTDQVLAEVGVEEPFAATTQMSPEGSDGQNDGRGPTGNPFGSETTGAVAARKAFEGEARAAALAPKYWSQKSGDYLLDDKQQATLKMSNAEGNMGRGSGIHYPSRVDPGSYASLQKQVQDIESMFGSREGYLGQHMDMQNSSETVSAAKNTSIEVPFEYAHTFDADGLKKLARDSSKDMTSRKMTLDRAYPTFKIFFVEEDEFETRYLSFDDFYSYNGVKDITVTSSRMLPAETAVITLQNVSGTLDGTKRNAVVDLDYFDKTAKDKLKYADNKEASTVSGDAVTAGTVQDQPFGAVVLRPGLNIQIRMGYSNDPDCLQVLMNGRIVDVSWNKSQDTAEILAHGFGAELIQVMRGMARDDSNTTYSTTHHLLGALMLSPELKHFGRWEFGQLFQYGEAKDSKLDFRDYSREGYLGKFKATNTLSNWVINHPMLVAAAAIGLTAASYFPLGKVLGISRLGQRLIGYAAVPASVGRGTLEKIFPLLGNGRRGSAVLLGARGARVNIQARAPQIAAAANALTPLVDRVLSINSAVEWKKVVYAGARSWEAAIRAAKTAEESITATLKFENELQMMYFRGQWMTKPWMKLDAAGGFLSAIEGIGARPFSNGITLLFKAPFAATSAALTAGLSIDLINNLAIQPIYNNTLEKARQFFAKKQSSLFLSPQDDNIYPPHPKDYMTLDRGLLKDTTELVFHAASRALFESSYPADVVTGLLEPGKFISKKVDPAAAEYQMVTGTIWDAFLEMTLRHPGWVFAPRPYGTDFRYTMFFGVPSQRYWARGAPNQFISRTNQLRKALEAPVPPVLEQEGNLAALDMWNTGNTSATTNWLSKEETRRYYAGESTERYSLTDPVAKTQALGEPFSVSEGEFEDLYGPDILRSMKEKLDTYEFQRELTAIPMREYLRALQIRFEPFRRYHMLTSERDIVWNGLIASENAVDNAVDVTYYPSPGLHVDSKDQMVETAVFKANASIPEHMLKIAPIRYDNCRTYQMAMRYGMGELMHRMGNMYRGEILLLGNPRIRPHDVAIIVDTYNDMTGPVEIEQVVHMFSHETGYLTEIKPAAVVVGNEISSWPLIEGMKTFALAVKDIEDRYKGIRSVDRQVQQTGFLGTALDTISTWGGEQIDGFMTERYKRLFGPQGATIKDLGLGETPPDLTLLDSVTRDLATPNNLELGFGAALTASGLSTALGVGGTIINASAGAGIAAAAFSGAGSFTKAGGWGFLVKHPYAFLGTTAVLATSLAVAELQVGEMIVNELSNVPSWIWLLGGPVLFLQCLRNEAVIVMPLMKSGSPIVAGLAYNDPTMIWNTFRGTVNRWHHDTVNGSRDLLSLWLRYGSSIWTRLDSSELDDYTGTAGSDVLPITTLPSFSSLNPFAESFTQ